MTEVTTEWEVALEMGDAPDTAGARAFPNWKVADLIRLARTDALATTCAEIAALKQWRDAVDDALICAHLGTVETFPDAKTALHRLICWEVAVALDPAVSEDARKLIATRGATIHQLGENAAKAADAVERLRVEAAFALANWSKYNGEQGDEIVYQAEKLAKVCRQIAALTEPTDG